MPTVGHPHGARGVSEQLVLTFSCECSEAGWFTPDEALGLVQAPQQKAKSSDALRPERGLRYRSYRTRPYEALLDEEVQTPFTKMPTEPRVCVLVCASHGL